MREKTVRTAAWVLALSLGSLGMAVSWAQVTQDQAPTEFDKVEEDWELVVARPDTVAVGPQITTCMTPFAVGVAPFVAFNLNYRERPTFQPGGMQIQVWTPAGELLNTASHETDLFSTRDERVTWTQRMRLIAGQVYYDIENGQSQTWGSFGQGNPLSVNYPASPTSLMGYDPDVSASRSGVSWQSNNVTRLVLLRVRYYNNGQLIWTDTMPRTVVQNTTADHDD